MLLLAAPAQAQEDLAAEGKLAPAFRLPVYNPEAAGTGVMGLDSFVGAAPKDPKAKLVLLSFMASFCGPCKKEMPYLQALYEKFKDQGLRVVMVSIDAEAEGQQKVADLLVENKVTFPVLKDRFNLVARRWLGNKSPLPSLFFVGKDGVITAVNRGYSQEVSSVLAQRLDAGLGLRPGTVASAVPAVHASAPVAAEGVKPAKATKGGKRKPKVAKAP